LSAGALLQTPLGELIALPRPLAVFRGTISKGKGRRGKEGKGVEGMGMRKKKEKSPPVYVVN